MLAMSSARPILFETATLLGFVVLGLLGLRIDVSVALLVIPATSYNYLGIIPVLAGVVLRFWASSTIYSVLAKAHRSIIGPQRSLLLQARID